MTFPADADCAEHNRRLAVLETEVKGLENLEPRLRSMEMKIAGAFGGVAVLQVVLTLVLAAYFGK